MVFFFRVKSFHLQLLLHKRAGFIFHRAYDVAIFKTLPSLPSKKCLQGSAGRRQKDEKLAAEARTHDIALEHDIFFRRSALGQFRRIQGIGGRVHALWR